MFSLIKSKSSSSSPSESSPSLSITLRAPDLDRLRTTSSSSSSAMNFLSASVSSSSSNSSSSSSSEYTYCYRQHHTPLFFDDGFNRSSPSELSDIFLQREQRVVVVVGHTRQGSCFVARGVCVWRAKRAVSETPNHIGTVRAVLTRQFSVLNFLSDLVIHEDVVINFTIPKFEGHVQQEIHESSSYSDYGIFCRSVAYNGPAACSGTQVN